MKIIRGQESLFAEAAGGLERRLPILSNNTINFGVEQGNLEGFLRENKVKVTPRDHAFSASQYLFDGFNDLEIIYGLPIQVYRAMNTSEIIAFFVGDWVMKKFPDIQFQRGKSYSQLKQDARVEDIVSAMVSIGYKYAAVRHVIGKGFSRHSSKPNDLIRRINSLPDDVKIKLLQALTGQRAVPSRENPKNWDYFDHNIVGQKFGYHTQESAQIYVDSFRRGIESVYRKHHRR